jgi:hypothetical protein
MKTSRQVYPFHALVSLYFSLSFFHLFFTFFSPFFHLFSPFFTFFHLFFTFFSPLFHLFFTHFRVPQVNHLDYIRVECERTYGLYYNMKKSLYRYL